MIASHTHELFKRIFTVLKPPPNLTMTQWADEHRILSKEAAAEPGRWRTSKVPYMAEIMNAISDTRTNKVVAMCAAQTGKTDSCILNPIGYFMHHDPAPIMVMQPSLGMGETFSKDRLSPMLHDTPVLRDKVDEKSRNSGNTILHKKFPGGHVTIVGANSPSGLRSRPIRILLADEIDGYPPTAGKDGDPLVLASKRLTMFWNKKEVLVSTPTVKGVSRIEVEFDNSTQEIWHVPCPACGEHQPLEWSQVLFNKDDLSEVNYTCAACGAIESEIAWKEQFCNGKYVPRHPERKVRGFFLNSLASHFVEWKEIVEKFLVANEEKKKGNIELLKAWTNTEMAQTWEEEGNEIEDDTLYNRRERYNCEVPNEVLYLTAGVDTQDDRFEIEVVGWGAEYENWGIKYHILYGDLQQQEVWDRLLAFLMQTFTKADGTQIRLLRTCIDAGGHFFNQVCKFCKPHFPFIVPIRGAGGFDKPYIPRPSKNNRAETPMWTLGVDTGKHLIYQSLNVELEDDEVGKPNYCHFPLEKDRGYNKDYFKGLTAERMVQRYKKGRAVWEWVLKQGIKRNEPFDLRNYARAALEISGVTLKRQEQTEKTTAPPRQRGRTVRGKGV